MRDALRDFLKPTDRLRSTLLSETLKKLLAANLVDPAVVGRGDFDQLCTYCNFEDGKPPELVDLLTVLTEAYQHLLSFGYIIPRPRSGSLDPDRFAVTKAGHQWAAGADPIPEDRAGYLAALLKLVPNLDSGIQQYAEEAVITYERRAFFASAVMIGAASEKAVYLLMEALQNAVSDPAKKKAIQKLVMEDRSLPKMFKRLRDTIDHAKYRPQ